MAATRLVERHAPGLARFVAGEGERDNVDEVVQDTFVRAFGAIDSFRGESAFRTWLFTIARRLILDRRRSERRSRIVATVEEGDAVTTFDALDTMVADESMVRVRRAVEALLGDTRFSIGAAVLKRAIQQYDSPARVSDLLARTLAV